MRPSFVTHQFRIFGKNEQARERFSLHWISDRLPDEPIADPVLLVIDMAADAKREAETQGIPGQEIDEEIGLIFEAIMHGLR